MGRGTERKKIFRNKTDRDDFLNRLTDLCRSGYLIIYAWVLMKLGYSGAEVSRYLGVTTSAVNRMVNAEFFTKGKEIS